MKLRLAIPSAVFLLAQVPIAWAVFWASRCAKTYWADVLAGAELPRLTLLAVSYGIAVPILSALGSSSLGWRAWRRQTSFQGCLFGAAVCEAILLAFLALALLLPAFTITTRIGS